MTRADELAALKSKLAARKDQPGWKSNVKAIESRIAELEKPSGN